MPETITLGSPKDAFDERRRNIHRFHANRNQDQSSNHLTESTEADAFFIIPDEDSEPAPITDDLDFDIFKSEVLEIVNNHRKISDTSTPNEPKDIDQILLATGLYEESPIKTENIKKRRNIFKRKTGRYEKEGPSLIASFVNKDRQSREKKPWLKRKSAKVIGGVILFATIVTGSNSINSSDSESDSKKQEIAAQILNEPAQATTSTTIVASEAPTVLPKSNPEVIAEANSGVVQTNKLTVTIPQGSNIWREVETSLQSIAPEHKVTANDVNLVTKDILSNYGLSDPAKQVHPGDTFTAES